VNDETTVVSEWGYNKNMRKKWIGLEKSDVDPKGVPFWQIYMSTSWKIPSGKLT
jgi:hypothetical protein